MCFLSVNWRFRFGHSQEFPRIQTSFLLNHFLGTWIIYFGGFLRNWKIINVHGSYGTYGRVETTRSLVIWTWILEILSNWQKQSLYFERRADLTNTRNRAKSITSTNDSPEYPRSMVFYGWIMKKSGFTFWTRVV